METFERSSRVEAPAADLYRWHARPGALERLTPPWERVRVVQRTGGIETGARAVIETKAGPFWLRWVAEHTAHEEGRFFEDTQRKGPFAHWVHRHEFHPAADGGSRLEDRVAYALPLGAVGRLLGGRAVARRLERLFRYRHATTAADVPRHAGTTPLRILVSGASGLVGSALLPFLRAGGHEVVPLTRTPAGDGILWDPEQRILDGEALEGFDAVIHLAGEPLAAGRWNDEKKRRILESRREGTRLLAERLGQLARKPGVFLSASAVGFYGDRGEEALNERSTGGTGFLAGVCKAWEDATAAAKHAGIRTALLRFGVIVSPRGGALARMLTPFRLGLGGRLGHGRQSMSWIGIDDVLGAIHHVLRADALSGPVNLTAPHAVTNAAWAKMLGRVLRRPALLPMPAPVARLAFGGVADELLLGGQRVYPKRLEETGYAFRHPRLEDALRHLLGRPA